MRESCAPHTASTTKTAYRPMASVFPKSFYPALQRLACRRLKLIFGRCLVAPPKGSHALPRSPCTPKMFKRRDLTRRFMHYARTPRTLEMWCGESTPFPARHHKPSINNGGTKKQQLCIPEEISEMQRNSNVIAYDFSPLYSYDFGLIRFVSSKETRRMFSQLLVVMN